MGVNILKSIDEGPFQMGTFRETLAEGNEGALHLGPEQARVYSDLSPDDKDMYNANIRATNILLQGLPKYIYTLINHYIDAKDIWDNVKMLLEGLSPTDNLIENLTNILALLTQSYKTYLPHTNNQLRTSLNIKNQAKVQDGRVVVQNVQGRLNRGQGNNQRGAGAAGNGGAQNRVGNANHENGVVLDKEQLLFLVGGHDTVVDEGVDESPVQDLALNVDNVFQADECDAFNSDVDEAPTAQTMFMENLSSADIVYDEVSLSYDSNILSEVHEYDSYQDVVCEHHEAHEMHHDVNIESVVPSNVSSAPNDAYMMIINEMHEQTAQSVSAYKQNKVVNASLTAELVTYKEQVELYERWEKFELTEREQKIKEQLRIVITDCNIKEENLKKELYSVKMQLNSTINHNKSMVEEVTSLKKDFKQKENKYLEEFLDMKVLKEKDVLKMKAEAQKEQTPASRPIKALMVYPPNTPAMLVPRLEAEVEQNVVNRKYDEIERKNLLIANENLIDDFLSKEVFYIATNSELTISRFTEMHDAHTVVQARCLEFKEELSKRHDKVQKGDHTELVKHFSNLEVNHLNLQLKYQNLKESFGNNTSLPAQDAPDFDSVFTRSEADRTLDFRALDFQITQLTEKVTVLQEQNELFRAENEKIKQHYKELYDSIKITHAKHIEQTTALLTENENLKAQTHENLKCINMDSIKPRVLAPGVNSCTDASGSQPRSNTKKNRFSSAKSVNEKKVEEHPRTNKSSLKTTNRVDSSISSKRTIINLNSHFVCQTCNKCLISANQDLCVVNYLHSVNASPFVKNVLGKVKKVWKPKQVKQVWKATRKVLTYVGYQWKPTGRIFTLRDQCPLTRLTTSNVLPIQQTKNIRTRKTVITDKLSNNFQKSLTSYQRRNKQHKAVPTSIPTPTINQAIDTSMPTDVAYANQQDPNKHWGSNFPNSPSLFVFKCRNFMKKFIGTVRFENDHFGAIMGYREYVIDDSVISRVYYVEEPGHNLFYVKQFCDFDLEVAFRKHSCYVQDIDGVELIKGSHGSNLYTISVEDMMNTIKDLARNDLVRGLPRLKFKKDHLCSVCQLGKSKKHTHTPKTENTNFEVLNTLHIDLCGPMRVQTINGKKYILVIVDDYSRYIRTDNGTKFFNQVLTKYYESVGIFHQKSVSRTPKQNDVVERRNCTLVKVARTMLIFSKALMFLWAEVLSEPMAPVQLSTEPAPTFMTPGQISSGLIPNLNLLVLKVWSPALAVPVLVNSVGRPSSTTIDQDAPSLCHLPLSSELQPPISHHSVAAASPIIEDNPFAHVDHDPFVNMFALEPSFEASSSGDVSSAKSTYVTQPHHHLRKWSKDHPLDNVIGNPSRPVSTRKQLATDALWCLYNSVLPKVKPKNFKSTVTDDCWFQAIQDEIYEFDQL
ncbi:retrovirus-related pol polyprotein from transposon TNT 1-94 [Tanacetum coccineum]